MTTIACSACGRDFPADLIDVKDDGTGNYTILQCRDCYGEGWAPMQTYSYDQLDDDAKARARDWYRGLGDEPDDMDHMIEDFERICELLGVTLSTHSVSLMGGGTRQEPDVYWSDEGASFEGSYAYKRGCLQKIRAYAPHDPELARIAAVLAMWQRRRFYQLIATIRIGSYSRSTSSASMQIDVDYRGNDIDDPGIAEALRDLADWLHGRILAEQQWQYADEQVTEAIICNEYEFDEEGHRA